MAIQRGTLSGRRQRPLELPACRRRLRDCHGAVAETPHVHFSWRSRTWRVWRDPTVETACLPDV